MNQTVFIYGLNDPETGKCRYIGKSDNPAHRYRLHLWNASRYKTHKDCWIKSLLSSGKVPVLEVLREVPVAGWQVWERAFIEVYQERGFDLTNLAVGGLGGQSGKSPSAETRLKLSLALRGRPGRIPSEGTRNKISNALSGRSLSLETIQKMSESRTGKCSPIKGKPWSEKRRAAQKLIASQ